MKKLVNLTVLEKVIRPYSAPCSLHDVVFGTSFCPSPESSEHGP